MEKTNWKVEGMTCSNCSLTVAKFLEKEGKKNVKVNLISGDVNFETPDDGHGHTHDESRIIKGIEELGYNVTTRQQTKRRRKFFRNHLQRFLFCAVFTIPLMLHMFNVPWIMNPWLQLFLCIPVYVVGMDFFGRSAIRSLRNGMPNMNVLIAIGATAAFVYSIMGTLMQLGHDYLFYETAAAIITLVFLGNYLEDVSISSTQRALNKLARAQKVTANMIAFNEDHEEVILPVDNDQLRTGDLILIKTGEQVPADCKILTGAGSADEAIITGESMPVAKAPKDKLIGGSLLTDGLIKAQVTAEAKDSVLANIVNLVKQAQGEKPPVQQMADRISAIFVPVVLGIAAITLIVNWIILDAFTPSMLRAIAVLVIACPCAMGLATPAAIAVGLGRAARNGVLFRNASSLEVFKNIRTVVFDKTGTLTTGRFIITNYHTTIDETEFKKIVYSLEKNSNHPIARSVVNEWKTRDDTRWSAIEEIKGIGMKGVTKTGDRYAVGSNRITDGTASNTGHNLYVIKNDRLVGWVDLNDEIRPEAKKVVEYLHKKNIRTVLLSGDRMAACKTVADQLAISEVFAEHTPPQKLAKIEALNNEAPTAMIGDGINDAPALAKASVGISLSEASQVAMQTADVVLINKGIAQLPLSLGLGRHTFMTIRQNLFWAFIYNIVAIPVAAFGFLTPAFGALVMGLSDVVLAINSVRLFVKKVV